MSKSMSILSLVQFFLLSSNFINKITPSNLKHLKLSVVLKSASATPPLQDDRQADVRGVERHGAHHGVHVRLLQHLLQWGRLHWRGDWERLLSLSKCQKNTETKTEKNADRRVQENQRKKEAAGLCFWEQQRGGRRISVSLKCFFRGKSSVLRHFES